MTRDELMAALNDALYKDTQAGHMLPWKEVAALADALHRRIAALAPEGATPAPDMYVCARCGRVRNTGEDYACIGLHRCAAAAPAPAAGEAERLREALNALAGEIEYGLARGECASGGQQVSPSAEAFTCVPSTRKRLARIAADARLAALTPKGGA